LSVGACSRCSVRSRGGPGGACVRPLHTGGRRTARRDGDHDADRTREQVSAFRSEKRSRADAGVIASRSEVHVVSPCRESPRATDVIEEASATRPAPFPEPRGFASPPCSGGAFDDEAEPTPRFSSVSGGQPGRYRCVARASDACPTGARSAQRAGFASVVSVGPAHRVLRSRPTMCVRSGDAVRIKW
jgi:hypothetical protein